MAKNDVTVELFYNGVWNDITSEDEVFTDSPITIVQGQTEDMAGLRPATISMRLNNYADKYRISNPMSPLYRLVGRNTPIRVSVDGYVRGIGEVNLWQCDQTQDFRKEPRRGKAWTDIQASGVLARVNKWKRRIRSPLYRYVTLNGIVPAEYWDMEVVSGSSEAPSAVGGSPLSPVTVVRYTLPDGSNVPPGGAPEFGKSNGIPGSDPLPNFKSGGTLAGLVRTTTFNGYAIDWVMQFDKGAADGSTTVDVLSWRESGTYVSFTVNVTEANVTVFHSNINDFTTLSTTGSCTASFSPFDGNAHHYRYQVSQDGADYLAELYIDSALYDTADNFGSPMTGTVGQPKSIQWNPLEDRGDYMPTAGHLIIWADGTFGGQPPVFFATNGYAIEKAADRMERIYGEENINFGLVGTSGESHQMGPQKSDTLFNLTREMLLTEDGLMYDDIDTLGVLFKLRNRRFNQTPTMTLYPEDLPKLPLEVSSSTDVWNIVTAKQRDGGESTAEDTTSYLSSQAPPDGVGEEKQDVDVNVYEEFSQLPQQANWWLRRGTVDRPKYPQLELDLNASPHLLAELVNIVVGSVIVIKNMREDDIRLYVLGWTEVIGTHSRKITYTCKPDDQFMVGEYDNTSRRYGTRTAALNEALDLTETGIDITATTRGDCFSATAVPYDIVIGGEVLTVTSAGAISGSGPYTQTLTCVRSVNGIIKTHASGDKIEIVQPGRYGL